VTFWVAVVFLALWITSLAFSPKSGARRIHEAKKKIYQTSIEPKLVDAASYQHLDLEFYRTTSAALESRGFTLLGDIDPGRRVRVALPLFIRIHASADGAVMASAYNFRARGLLRLVAAGHRDLRAIDLESELSDGTFVATSNAYSSRHITRPPEVFNECLPADTALHALLRRHLERLGKHSAERSCVPVSINSLEAALQSQARLRCLKAEFESARGHKVSRAELVGIASNVAKPGAVRAAEDIADEMDRDET
jgi:hypothetical protein